MLSAVVRLAVSHVHPSLLMVCAGLALVACGDEELDASDDATPSSDVGAGDAGAGEDSSGAADADGSGPTEEDAAEEGSDVAPPPVVAGRCTYTNSFSNAPECKQYDGEVWDEAAMAEDCSVAGFGAAGELTVAAACEPASLLGVCTIIDDAGRSAGLYVEGPDNSTCDIATTACEVFSAGTFAPAEICADGGGTGGGGGEIPAGVFIPPTLSCVAPPEGETGNGPDGEVCTWNMISGCTEEGKNYADYGSCEAVLTQRPYAGFTYPFSADPEDPRLEDEEFQTELAWITEQVEACACVCCHSTEVSPGGDASGWYLEASDIWIDSVPDTGIAIMAGIADSTAFGAYPPEENNGFQRTITGLPSNDGERMRTFFLQEWLRRGYVEADAAEIPPFGGPLVAQQNFEPQACQGTIGVSADGTVNWGGAAARYVYVLESGSANPGVPPNLDLPEGTLWRLDVPPTGISMESGIRYGQTPEGVIQRFPESGAPAALQAGEEYYIYVLLDVGVPLARCLFEFEG